MKKISYWANFCPRKLYYELSRIDQTITHIDTWWEYPQLLKKQLLILKEAGLSGIKLNVFNFELTDDGQHLDFTPIDVVLSYCQDLQLGVHICLGPYQFPLWPGIRLPMTLRSLTFKENIDQHKLVRAFGTHFLAQMLKKYGRNKQISGFYLGNEWHTDQEIEDYKSPTPSQKKFTVSQKHMQSLARECRKNTRKPIFFNTNIDPYKIKLIEHVFLPFMNILKDQFFLGFDVYPSQETFVKSPVLFLHRKLRSYAADFSLVEKKCTTHLILSELEAQPWGNGQSWYEQIQTHPNLPKLAAQQLQSTNDKVVKSSNIELVTLWGTEFWLAAHAMGDHSMLNSVANITAC